MRPRRGGPYEDVPDAGDARRVLCRVQGRDDGRGLCALNHCEQGRTVSSDVVGVGVLLVDVECLERSGSADGHVMHLRGGGEFVVVELHVHGVRDSSVLGESVGGVTGQSA